MYSIFIGAFPMKASIVDGEIYYYVILTPYLDSYISRLNKIMELAIHIDFLTFLI